MKRQAAFLSALLAITIGCAPAPAPEQTLPPLEGFDWLVGCWLSRDGVVERWEPPGDSLINGSTLMPDADGAQVGQTLRISTTEAGGVEFSAQIGDQPAQAFQLVSNSESQAVFENLRAADIRRITYRRDREALVIVLQGGDEQAWEARYVTCSGGDAEQPY